MTHAEALELVKAYVAGWSTLNQELIFSTISDDCVVVESHGPTYTGIDEIRRWIVQWGLEGQVDHWQILTFSFDEPNQTGFFEWDFACTVAGEPHAFKGATICHFSDGKIDELHEYRMTDHTDR